MYDLEYDGGPRGSKRVPRSHAALSAGLACGEYVTAGVGVAQFASPTGAIRAGAPRVWRTP
jgi:hypothetical protein